MVLEVGARALTKHALNVHGGHDDFYAALDTGWTMLMARDAQQAADQAVILRKVNELTLNPGMNIQEGMLTTHSERTYLSPEADLLREFLGLLMTSSIAQRPRNGSCSVRSAGAFRK
jgi:pyruvate-ferredoxin/flavodoxin oxidoreductase